MSEQPQPEARGYENLYKEFDSPLMQKLRLEAYGQDIGQHSWVTAEELAQDIPRLGLSRPHRFLDLGCGPGGPLTFVIGQIGCRGTGVDLSASAINSARARAASLGLTALVELRVADSNEPIPFGGGSFDAIMSLDVILHLRDRASLFAEVARVLVPGGRFLFTDAGVIAGPVSNEEVRQRAVHGFTQFAPSGFNERALERAGLKLVESQDRTASLLRNATGRLASRLDHRAELEELEGPSDFEEQLRYLETVIALSERRAVSRVMYLAESAGT